MSFEHGNKRTGKHYWLTPPPVYRALNEEFNFDFDPCPYPRPGDFDGLSIAWGMRNFVNPPFASIIMPNGKKAGVAAWTRKARAEAEMGRLSVFLLNLWDGDALLQSAAGIRVLSFAWLAIEDGSPAPRKSNVAVYIIRPNSQGLD